jgi:hypothetical protein
MNIKGEKLGTDFLGTIQAQLEFEFNKKGFITNVYIVNSQSIKIGLWMRTFKLDTLKHDRNLQVNPYQSKLTSLPNWDQRVIFNNIVNKVLDKFKVSANIKSGPYTIREGLECMTEYDWQDQKPAWVYENERKGYYVIAVNEKEFIAQRKEKRRLAQKERR